MVMRNKMTSISLRTVKTSFPRFLSLLVMSLLGVGVFAGIQATGPDMTRSLDEFLDAGNTYDVKIVSSLGLTESDAHALAALPGVSGAEGGFTRDVLVSDGEKDSVVKIISLPESINTITLQEGRLPENSSEILAESAMLKRTGFTLGGSLALKDDVLGEKTFTIVGVADSPLYFNNVSLKGTRGMTGLGTGEVNFYAYAMPESFDTEYYSCIYLTARDAKETVTASKEYLALTEKVLAQAGEIRTSCEDARNSDILAQAESELEEKSLEAKEELDSSLEKLETARQQLDDSQALLESKRAELEDSREALQKQEKLLQGNLTAAGMKAEDVPEALAEAQNTLRQAQQTLAMLPQSSAEYAQVSAAAEQLQATVTALETLTKGLDALAAGKKDIAKAQEQLDKAAAEQQNGEREYTESLQAYKDAVAEWEKKTEDARAELQNLPQAHWYLYDRTDDSVYNDFINDTQSITNLSVIFPTVFFVVAILISLISMNRMVEEDRTLIGTLKSMGFSGGRILQKYLLFALAATLAGGLIGAALGLTVIPTLIWNIYTILFSLPAFRLGLNLSSTLTGLLIAIVCICGTTIYTAAKELKSVPAALMRPRAPKAGKRIILEHIPFLWKRMRFSQKVTARNIFRYGKRVLMTVVGAMGCTALMLSGFGLRDAIVDIPTAHFGGVYTYDLAAYVSEELQGEELRAAFRQPGVTAAVETDAISATVGENQVTLMVPADAAELPEVLTLKDVRTGKPVFSGDGAVITDKLAQLTGLAIGDNVTVLDTENRAYTFPVTGIAEYYINHEVVVARETFERAGGTYRTNQVLLTAEQGTDEQALCSTLLMQDGVLTASGIHSVITSADNMLKSLNSVVLILIVLASMLSFVVLYNLSNININERRREIATLKVLGFFDREVDSYITRETALLTGIGIALGLIAGTFLTGVIVSTVEIERVRFLQRILFPSYLYAAGISALFTFTVNLLTHCSLKKIDMIESLKSVE